MTTYDLLPKDRIVFGIVLNDISDKSITTDIDLSGWTLGKASHNEMKLCSEELRKYCAINFFTEPLQERFIWRTGSNFILDPLDISKWRYSVVRPTNSAKLNGAEFSEALRISDENIFVELWCIKSLLVIGNQELVIGGNSLQCMQYLVCGQTKESHVLDVDHLKEVVNLRAQFDNSKYNSIVKSIQMFRALDINHPSAVKILGYFSIIESLLSHQPRQNDSADSISRQLKRNLILLNNRMSNEHTLCFNEFRSFKPDTVISKLYEYRSAIAHGGNELGIVKTLIDDYQKLPHGLPMGLWPDYFLRRLVKRVLVHALREPQLVLDLKG